MSLRTTVLSAGRWTASSAVLVSGLQLAQTLVLARLLSPAEFGVMAIAAAILAVLSLVADFGLSRAVIHFDDIAPDVLGTMYWMNVAIATALAMGLAGFSPLIAALYDSPMLAAVVSVSCLLLPITALGQQFRATAEKELRFRLLAGIDICSAIAGFGFAVGAAVLGAGVFSLVIGLLASAALGSFLVWRTASEEQRPGRPSFTKDALPYLRYGTYLVGDNLASTVHRQSDVFIGGLFAAPGALGLFSVARDLSLKIALAINPIATRIGFPVMSRVKHDREALREVYSQTLRMTASINFPIYLSLALFADDVAIILYGKHWQGVGSFLQILGLWGMVRSTGNPVGSLLYAVGRTRRAMYWNLALLLLLPAFYWVAAFNGGLTGLAFGMLAAQLLILPLLWYFLVKPCCDMSLAIYLRPLAAPLALSVIAAVTAHFVSRQIEHAATRLVIGIGVGAAVYLGLSLRLNPRWASTMMALAGLRRHHEP